MTDSLDIDKMKINDFNNNKLVQNSIKTESPPKIHETDPYLTKYKPDYKRRNASKKEFLKNFPDFEYTTEAYKRYGIHTTDNKNFTCLEFVPDVLAVHLTGEFNDWKSTENSYDEISPGLWSLKFKTDRLVSGSKLKLAILTKENRLIFRVSPWARYLNQTEETLKECSDFQWIYLKEENYEFKHLHVWPKASQNASLKIYEAHVGICTEQEKVSTYQDFKKLIPKISELGYNSIQLMAVMEHAYYASFGYQITSFFAPSSRFGTPNELKQLIDEAHKFNISVLLDVVHSHASINVEDGLNDLNGTGLKNPAFFHKGLRGNHSQWGSKVFDYRKTETVEFLISNLRYWVEEFRFDGFRFDGVTSMLYTDHAINRDFSGDYGEYFGFHIDEDSINYLQIANEFLHEKYPGILTIAEEVSGMPGTCKPVSQDGLGFDYRLQMAIPDMWIKLLKEVEDENWNMGDIVWTLINRRHDEPHICYTESHDQCLVGDKTIAFRLMDKEMYTNMSILSENTEKISRGLALHKMIRLLTHTLGGEAYLNFMGNEFGHPEWLDFPRKGNNESYQYARRQYNLAENEMLRYSHLNAFDKAMNNAENEGKWLAYEKNHGFVSKKHESDKVLAFERNECIFVFNFNLKNSFENYKIGTNLPGKYKILLCTDEKEFHGYENVSVKNGNEYFTNEEGVDGRGNSIQVYLPSRVAIIFIKVD